MKKIMKEKLKKLKRERKNKKFVKKNIESNFVIFFFSHFADCQFFVHVLARKSAVCKFLIFGVRILKKKSIFWGKTKF